MKYYVYILQTVNNKLYCGIARDVQKRFIEHQEGRGAKFTRANKPLKIVYCAQFEGRSEASVEEYRIKHLDKKRKLELVEGFVGNIGFVSMS